LSRKFICGELALQKAYLESFVVFQIFTLIK
jgi:hypothetical protein